METEVLGVKPSIITIMGRKEIKNKFRLIRQDQPGWLKVNPSFGWSDKTNQDDQDQPEAMKPIFQPKGRIHFSVKESIFSHEGRCFRV